MKYCSLSGCEGKHYAKGYCRKHYRIESGEFQKRNDKIKSDPELYNRTRKSQRKYEDRIRKTEPYREKRRNYLNRRYEEDEEFRNTVLERNRKYKESLSDEKRKESYKRDNYKRWFDRNREKAVERDGLKCVICGITREEHKEKYNCDLHVHHIDKKGRGVDRENRNNKMENLMTLCASCHRKEDSK